MNGLQYITRQQKKGPSVDFVSYLFHIFLSILTSSFHRQSVKREWTPKRVKNELANITVYILGALYDFKNDSQQDIVKQDENSYGTPMIFTHFCIIHQNFIVSYTKMYSMYVFYQLKFRITRPRLLIFRKLVFNFFLT